MKLDSEHINEIKKDTMKFDNKDIMKLDKEDRIIR